MALCSPPVRASSYQPHSSGPPTAGWSAGGQPQGVTGLGEKEQEELKFLVRKWNKVNRKGSCEDSGTLQAPVNRMDVLQPLGGTTLNSPPTRDLYRSPNASVGTISLKPSQWTPKGTGLSSAPERSYHSSQDAEHSITEYIHHLEMVQRRLGGLQNDPKSEQAHSGKYAWK